LNRGLARRKASACIKESTNRINADTDVHASSGIQAHDLSIRAVKDIIYIVYIIGLYRSKTVYVLDRSATVISSIYVRMYVCMPCIYAMH
jgi:hypothetical protein